MPVGVPHAFVVEAAVDLAFVAVTKQKEHKHTSYKIKRKFCIVYS